MQNIAISREKTTLFLNLCSRIIVYTIFLIIFAHSTLNVGQITKSNMEIQRYNRLKAASKRVQSEVLFDSAEQEQARTQFKIVLAEKEKTGTWLSEQMGHSISTVHAG